MDLIRIFIDTSFARIAERYLKESEHFVTAKQAPLIIDEAMFVDECRLRHTELSDDQIKTIYALYRDEWSYELEDLIDGGSFGQSIFNVLFRFGESVLRINNSEPQVKFNHLLRWREVTQMIGEDLLVTAYLAFLKHRRNHFDLLCSRLTDDFDEINFGAWPNVLHNDNPNLNHIFEKRGLYELHSHLKASTDNFALSWVCLMNNVTKRLDTFQRAAKKQDVSRGETVGKELHDHILEAALIRVRLWKYLYSGEKIKYILKSATSFKSQNLSCRLC